MSPANVYTPSQCLNECINAKTRFQFDCRSVMWFRESSECILNSKSKDEVDSIVSNELSFGVDFYDNECIFDTVLPNTNGVATHRAELQISNIIPGVRSCFTKYRHSSLVGYLDKILDNVTERECLSECWRCGENTQCFSQIDEMCKSVTYYGTSKQCIMTSKTKRVNPGFFDATENLSDFFERRRDCTYENCEDLEIGLIFVLDGSDSSLAPDSFNRSLILVDKTITEIHETTEFWRLLIIQLGSIEPSVVEIPVSTFNTLDDMRNSLYSISWRNFSDGRQGESLLEVVQIVDQIKSNYDLDYSWVFFITNGLNFDKIDEFVQIKNRKEFTSFAIGVGDELNFPILEQLATSNDHLIHAQSPEMVAKQVSAKLCVNNGIVFQSKQTNDWDTTLQNFHENGIRRAIPLKNSALASQTFQLIKEEPVWLGLHRDEFGKMIWDNEAEISEYDQKLLNHLETGVDTGDCILWLQPKKWIQSKCSLKYRYVCNLKPLQTINEKLVQLVNKSTNLPETSLGSTTVSGVEELIPFGVSSATG
uniref:C-type lectin domain-containing protein n=1 Tax=Acrobeloides nanus TaxID=290746 RepID=A0A914C8S9_9BILA